MEEQTKKFKSLQTGKRNVIEAKRRQKLLCSRMVKGKASMGSPSRQRRRPPLSAWWRSRRSRRRKSWCSPPSPWWRVGKRDRTPEGFATGCTGSTEGRSRWGKTTFFFRSSFNCVLQAVVNEIDSLCTAGVLEKVCEGGLGGNHLIRNWFNKDICSSYWLLFTYMCVICIHEQNPIVIVPWKPNISFLGWVQGEHQLPNRLWQETSQTSGQEEE